jgi:hypothetical protein
MCPAKMLARDGVKAKSYGRAAAGLDTVSSRLMTGLSVVLILNSLGAQQGAQLATGLLGRDVGCVMQGKRGGPVVVAVCWWAPFRAVGRRGL